MVASLGAMKDMITDSMLLNTLCSLENANRILKSQFRNLDKFENWSLFKANAFKVVGMEASANSIQAIKNIFFSSYSTFELIEAVISQFFKI